MNIRELWLDFRNGQIYFAFMFSIGTFMITSYALILQPTIGNDALLLFGILFPIIYIPSVLLIGKMHRKYQYQVDFKQQFESNKTHTKVYYIILRAIREKATLEELDWLENYLGGLSK